MKPLPKFLLGTVLVALAYIGAYFLIFEPGTSLVEGGVDYSVSRFGEVERVGDLSIYIHRKHWTNVAWRPVDVVVRRLRQAM